MLDFQLVKPKHIFSKKKAFLIKKNKIYSTMYCIIHSKTYIFVI
jgi:hypothetical protein